MTHPRYSTHRGFTIIEMLVSLALFAVVITMSVGTLLVLIGGNLQTQEESNSLNNLTFALDSMSREIRTGTDYVCGNHAGFNNQESLTEGEDCRPPAFPQRYGTAVSFVETGSSITGASIERIAFSFNDNKLWRRVGDGAPQQLTASDVHIHDARFYVTGAKRLSHSSNDTDQPMVTIKIVATSQEDAGVDCTTDIGACLHIQTTVTQRVLDI